jgi:hypothetical protein
MMLGFGTGSAAHPLNDTAAIGVVRGFLDEVRSGRDPDAAARYFALSTRWAGQFCLRETCDALQDSRARNEAETGRLALFAFH